MLSLKGNNTYTKARVLLLITLIALFSCDNTTFNDEADLMAFLQDETNGYVYNKTVNGVDFTLLYRPTDLLVEQELSNGISLDKVKALREKYSKYLYFNLSMSKNNKELLSTAPKNRNEFGAMVNQLAFGMRDKVHMFTQEKDTLEMVDYVYPRMYGMSKSTTMMFVYPREHEKIKDEFINFTIQDLGLYTGEVKFKIQTDKIINEPQLAF